MRSSRPARRAALRLVLRRVSQWIAGPVVAGVVLALAGLAGVQIAGPVRWLALSLSLTPAALVHCHNRDRHFSWAETCAVGLAAAGVAYAVIVVGVFTGATITFAVYVAAKTGALAALAQITGVLGFAVTVWSRRRPACTTAH